MARRGLSDIAVRNLKPGTARREIPDPVDFFAFTVNDVLLTAGFQVNGSPGAVREPDVGNNGVAVHFFTNL